MKSPYLPFATWLRATSVILILLCHYCAQCDISIVAMLSQVFNIGVQLFFILSGFLVGYKGIPKPYGTWYVKRIKRIFFPYWTFLVVLAIVYVIKGLKIFTLDWCLLVFGMQGSNVGVWGAEQTWFISVLLVCYLLSPAILHTVRILGSSKKHAMVFLATAGVSVLPVLYSLCKEPWVYTLLTPISFYALSCAFGMVYNAKRSISAASIIGDILIIIAAFGFRFATKVFYDDTIFYNRVVVPYTHMFAACAIFALYDAAFRKRRVPAAVKFLADISFEIYLYHYMFTVGLCLSIRNCIKRAPKSTVPGQHRFGFEKPCFCSL